MSIATLSHQHTATPPPPFRTDRPAPAAPARDHLRAVPALHLGPLSAHAAPVSENLRRADPGRRPSWTTPTSTTPPRTPALGRVKAAVDVALRTYSSVHRGNG